MPIKLTEFNKYEQRLKEYFPQEDLQFKIGATSGDKSKGIALAYINSSAVMDRLDEVLGAENWTKKHSWGEKGEIMCGISILFEYPDGSLKWHTKWDAGVQPEFEPEKGGISDSLKRAANCWGIGRYLRKFPQMWLPIEKRGRNYYFKNTPKIPKEFVPNNSSSGNGSSSSSDNKTDSNSSSGSDDNIINDRKKEIGEIFKNNNDLCNDLKKAINEFLNACSKETISSLSKGQYQSLIRKLNGLKKGA